MNITWILEENVFSEESFDTMVNYFQNNDIKYHTVRVTPFIHKIDGKIPDITTDNVVVYGSIGAQKIAIENNWIPGVWTNSNFNSETYKNIGKYFINSDVDIMKISEVLDKCDLDIFFIKPNSDNKEFAGVVMRKDEFSSWYKKMLDIGYLDTNDFDVAISPPINISEEYRLVVVNKKIVAGSLYKKYGIVYTKEGWIPEFQTLIDEIGWHPDSVYVVDFGLTEDGWRVIEYNTFNSAGFYKCDITSIINSINKFVLETWCKNH